MDDYTRLSESPTSGGLEAGLRFLNRRVDHRFTAVYRLQDMVPHNVELIDKIQGDDLVRTGLQAVPLDESFCQFVMRDGFFRVSRTTGMEALDGHPHQGVMERCGPAADVFTRQDVRHAVPFWLCRSGPA
jgi:hypothetical protein